MHAATATSTRLSRVVALLSDGEAHTTREIAHNAECMAVSAAVAELRQRGAVIDCWPEVEAGKRRYCYRMVRRPDDA